MMALKNKYAIEISILSKKINTLKNHSINEYFNIGKFCLDSERPY